MNDLNLEFNINSNGQYSLDEIKKLDYYERPELSQSMLKELKKSPLHLWHKYINPNRIQETTPAMEFGKALHCAILEPITYADTYVIEPVIDKRTKDGKYLYQEFVANNKDKNIISQDDFNLIDKIKNKLNSIDTWQVIISNKYVVEKEIYFTLNSIECKMKVDLYVEPCNDYPNGLIVDVKTTQDARDTEFAKSIFNFGYHNQVAFYQNGIMSKYGLFTPPPFLFVAIEKKEPIDVTFLQADERMVNFGAKENDILMSIYKECKAKAEWQGYDHNIRTVSLPTWVKF
jgi:exodeoxyribonuclease VIII